MGSQWNYGTQVVSLPGGSFTGAVAAQAATPLAENGSLAELSSLHVHDGPVTAGENCRLAGWLQRRCGYWEEMPRTMLMTVLVSFSSRPTEIM